MKLREEEFYEQYHQHGGTTIIPTEIFDELYDDATEEIERLNNKIKEISEEMNYQINLKTRNANEINRLNNIINELEKEKDKLGSLFYERNEENIKLHSIIKEVRENIKENSIYYPTSDGCQWVDQFKVLEILDKVDKENNNE